MGHESQIELWSPNLTTFCFVGFGTDRLRRQEAMKTAGRENPNHRSTVLHEHMARVGQNRSRSLKWAEKQENFQPKEMCFFLTSTFIEPTRTWLLCNRGVGENDCCPAQKVVVRNLGGAREWLALAVGQRTPEPFQGSILKLLQPDG